MKITNIRLKKNMRRDDQLLGVVSIQLDNCLLIHNIKIVQLKDGRRIISFPNKKAKRYEQTREGNYILKSEYSDLVHPSNPEFRKYIETEIFKYFDMNAEVEDE